MSGQGYGIGLLRMEQLPSPSARPKLPQVLVSKMRWSQFQ